MKTPSPSIRELPLAMQAFRHEGVVLDNSRASGILNSTDSAAYHGMVCLANDSLLREVTPIEEVTAFAISYDGQVGNKLAKLRDFVAPKRSTSSRIARLMTYDENEPFQTVDYTKVKRGILGDFAEVRQRIASKADIEVPNRGLMVVLDRDQLKDKPDWQMVHTKWMIDLMMRATILEAVATLEAAATQSATTWDSASNPDLEIRQIILTQANVTGFYPQNVAYGDLAHLKRSVAYESQLTAGSLARAGQFTEEQLATALSVNQVLINAERYATAASAAVKTEIIGSNVLVFTATPESPMDASNIVRHVSSTAGGGGDYAVYETPIGVKKVVLTVENYEYIHTQHTTGVQQVAVN